MKLKKIVISKCASALVEVILEVRIGMLPSEQGICMPFPSLFKSFGLTDVDSVGMGVDDLVNSRFWGVFVVVELH